MLVFQITVLVSFRKLSQHNLNYVLLVIIVISQCGCSAYSKLDMNVKQIIGFWSLWLRTVYIVLLLLFLKYFIYSIHILY